jgi:signal transduction histidine kinase/CheY-like chemotaxis protein
MDGAVAFLEDEDENGSIYEHQFYPVMGEDGVPNQLAIYSVDITDRRASEEEREKLQAQLQQAQKMEAIGTLAGGIAHDFNNLMMAIQGNVSLVLMNMPPTHAHYEPLKNIERGIRKGADLTAKLLGYARKGKYEIKPVNLNLLVKETSETFGRMRKDITIESELSKELSGIMADKVQLEQILLNLFVNAADAMPGGGTLTLKTRNVTHESIPTELYRANPGMYVQLAVTDTGTGMPPEVQERIFDPFFTTKKMGQGTGLGLASAYGIVKNHNGYIEVESAVDQGSTFYIYLPASEGQPRENREEANRVTTGSGTLLLVDDEQNVLTVTSQMLTRSGYTVIEAKSGREAIERYSRHQDEIDLVLLDMVMPEMGGGEVYDRIKALNATVKVLLASGYSLEGKAREIMKRGCDGFIQKPFSLAELADRVKSILERN